MLTWNRFGPMSRREVTAVPGTMKHGIRILAAGRARYEGGGCDYVTAVLFTVSSLIPTTPMMQRYGLSIIEVIGYDVSTITCFHLSYMQRSGALFSHLALTSTSTHPHSDLISTSTRRHLFLILTSTHPHLNFNSTSLQPHMNFS